VSRRARASEFADLDQQLDALLHDRGVDDDGDDFSILIDEVYEERLAAHLASQLDDDGDDEPDEPEEGEMSDITDGDEDDDLDEEEDTPEAPSWLSHRGLSEDALRDRSREAGRREIEATRARCAARREAA
jgi:hypothetical protein